MYTICRKTASKRDETSWINPKDAVQEEEVDEDLDYFDKEMDEQFNPKVGDQWKHYTTQEGRTATRPVNVFHWW